MTLDNGPRFGIRHLQIILLFLSVGLTTIARNCITVGILAMVEKSNNSDVQVYDWNKTTQGYVLSSLMWGEMIMQALGGILINKYGSKLFMTISTFICGAFLMFQPAFTEYGDWIGVCVCRVIQGMFISMVFPCVHELLGRWSPMSERLRSGILVYSGSFTVMTFGMPIAAYIGNSKYGWPWIFYTFGFTMMLFALLWSFLGAESPSKHKTISEEEKKFIESSLDTAKYEKEENKNEAIPWKAIFTSKPYWAIILTQITCDYGYTTVQTEMATYFKMGLNVDLVNTGLATSLANIVSAVFMILASIIADYIYNKKYLSNTTSRKVFNTIGCCSGSLSLALIVFIPNLHYTFAIAFIVLCSASDSILTMGFFLNHIDLSPRYASILFGIAMNAAKLTSMMSPVITGYIVLDPTNLNQWKIVFSLTSAMYFIGNLIFFVFGSAEKQSWDSPVENDDKGIKSKECLLPAKSENPS